MLGYTHIETRTIDVIGPGLHGEVLGHEMVHVVDYAQLGHAGHCGWKTRGVTAAIYRLTGDHDLSETFEECLQDPGP